MRMSFKLCDCAHKKVKEISRGTNGKEIGKQKLKWWELLANHGDQKACVWMAV